MRTTEKRTGSRSPAGVPPALQHARRRLPRRRNRSSRPCMTDKRRPCRRRTTLTTADLVTRATCSAVIRSVSDTGSGSAALLHRAAVCDTVGKPDSGRLVGSTIGPAGRSGETVQNNLPSPPPRWARLGIGVTARHKAVNELPSTMLVRYTMRPFDHKPHVNHAGQGFDGGGGFDRIDVWR